MNIILLGAPGSGKGTQAELLAKHFGLFYLQAGEIARQWASQDPRIKAIVNSGKLIPEEEMSQHIFDYLEKNAPEASNILFEGFPRFITQYLEYENWLEAKGQRIDAVVSLDLSEEAAVKRLSSRRTCKNCGETYNLVTKVTAKDGICDKCGGELVVRDDDNPASIKVRFEYYENNTKKLIDFLDSQKTLIRVDADRPINDINNDIITALESYSISS